MSTAKHSVIRLPAVLARVGISRSSIYAAIARNAFPAPISLGPRSVGWLESDVDEWLAARVDAGRSGREAA